jgi:hypothetical protein
MSFTLARPAAGLALLAALAAVCTTAATAQPATAKPAATARHHHFPPMHAAVTTPAASTVPVLRVNRPAPAGVRPGAVRVAPLRVPDPAVYAAQKAAADAAAAQRARRRPSRPARAAVLAPALVRNWAGQRDTTVAPSDSTGAIGTTRYIELVNAQAAVYRRTSNTPAAAGALLQLTGCATAGCTDNVFDPQVIWDPGTSRFFYVADDIVSSTQNLLDVGFSTTATPDLSASSWCRFALNFGATFPDYPKLGDTQDFMLIGSNDFAGPSFTGSTIAWMTKPPPGTACPAPGTLAVGLSGALKNADGTAAFTPVPANQTDTSPAGWAVARPASIPPGGAAFLTVFTVTKSAAGAAVIPVTGAPVPVSAFQVPASAAQPGTADTLDTLDARNTQAVSAVDPTHGGVTALWTQHAVFGGAGSQVRWYEINPATHTLIQHGTLTSALRFTFDGAISPDRLVNGTTSRFGGDMVIDVARSSMTTLPAIKAASKIGPNPVSALRTIATSAASDTGFDCLQDAGLCRWGDYAAATPDPAAPTTATTGQIWGSSMLAAPGGNAASAGWTTRNFAIKP